MLSILAVTAAPRKGLPASPVPIPVPLPSEAAATVPLGNPANHNAKPKIASPSRTAQTLRSFLVIDILLMFLSFKRYLRFGTLNDSFQPDLNSSGLVLGSLKLPRFHW